MSCSQKVPKANKNPPHKYQNQFYPNSGSNQGQKQFELLYRTRDHLPSQEAYQSVIFMKSKKCPKPQINDHQKTIKKPSSSQLKNMIKNIQKEIKTHQAKQQNQKHTTNIKSKSNIAKRKLKHSPNAKKKSNLEQSNNVHAKSLHSNKKTIELGKRIKSPPSSHQLTQGRSNRDNTSSRKDNNFQFSSLKQIIIPSCKQYILIGQNFVSIDKAYVSNIQKKLISTYRQVLRESRNRVNDESLNHAKPVFQATKKQNDETFPKTYDCNFGYNVNYKYFSSQQNSISQDDVRNSTQSDKSSKEINFESVQQFIKGKAVKIQRWWRRVIQRNKVARLLTIPKTKKQQDIYEQAIKKTTNTPMDEEAKIDIKSQTLNNPMSYFNDISSQKSYNVIGGVGDPQSMETIRNIFEDPNKNSDRSIFENQNFVEDQKIQQKINSSKNSSHEDILNMRKNAADIQFSTHKSILSKLHDDNKISKKTYLEKLSAVESTYHSQMFQIDQIKQILQKNAERVEKLLKKTKQDMLLAEQSQNMSQQEVLCKIFGKPIQNLPSGRQKSKGCHFNPPSKEGKHYFQKQSYQEFSSESDEQEQKRISQSDQVQFYEAQAIHPDFLVNANFKQLLEEYKQRQTVKNEIDHHLAVQMGIVPFIPQQNCQNNPTINASITGIHQFLVTFFKFYTYYYKDEFLRLINMPYGYSPQKRLSCMQGYEQKALQEDQQGVIYGLQTIINQQILDEFHQHYYEQIENPNQLRTETIKYDKIHNKAIFDGFNQALNYFRPYYNINGPPYPWNNSQKALTFYFIAEQNIRQVFEKTQFRLLKWVSSLCGTLMNKYDKPLISSSKSVKEKRGNHKDKINEEMHAGYRESSHPVVIQVRQQKMFKAQKIEVQEGNYEWLNLEQQRTLLLYEISTIIFEDLALEAMRQSTFIQNHKKQGIQILE